MRFDSCQVGSLRRNGAAAAVVCTALLAGCGGGGDNANEPTSASSATVDSAKPKLALEEVGKFTEPVALAGADDGTLYVGERAGLVKAFDPDVDARPETVLDLTKDVYTEGEGSVLSLGVAPVDGPSDLYVSYAGKDHAVHLDGFTLGRSPDATLKSRRELLAIDHPEDVHWGGHIDFDDKGLLYLSTGDGGPVAPRPLTAQDTDELRGKLLRINPAGGEEAPYGIPDSNPLIGKGGREEIIDYGLRNPWQFSIDGKDIWIGDVGDFQAEEVDLASTDTGEAANYGWPILEGSAETGVDGDRKNLVAPVLEYERTGHPDDPNCAITGGHVVRDRALKPLYGRYIYADFCKGEILAAKPSKDGLGKPEPTGLEMTRIASFAQDADGHSYAVTLEGPVYRITFG